jgi:hypothetical protein
VGALLQRHLARLEEESAVCAELCCAGGKQMLRQRGSGCRSQNVVTPFSLKSREWWSSAAVCSVVWCLASRTAFLASAARRSFDGLGSVCIARDCSKWCVCLLEHVVLCKWSTCRPCFEGGHPVLQLSKIKLWTVLK